MQIDSRCPPHLPRVERRYVRTYVEQEKSLAFIYYYTCCYRQNPSGNLKCLKTFTVCPVIFFEVISYRANIISAAHTYTIYICIGGNGRARSPILSPPVVTPRYTPKTVIRVFPFVVYSMPFYVLRVRDFFFLFGDSTVVLVTKHITAVSYISSSPHMCMCARGRMRFYSHTAYTFVKLALESDGKRKRNDNLLDHRRPSSTGKRYARCVISSTT